MPPTPPSRTEMIGCLVDHAVARAHAGTQPDWLRDVFENGFAGYGRFSDRQLRHELELRGLNQASAQGTDDAEDDFPFSLTPI